MCTGSKAEKASETRAGVDKERIEGKDREQEGGQMVQRVLVLGMEAIAVLSKRVTHPMPGVERITLATAVRGISARHRRPTGNLLQ